MGYYIETDRTQHRAGWLVRYWDGQIITKPKSFSEIPADKALIVVVQNGYFDAAGLCYSESEFEAFTDPTDPRPITYVLLDKELVYKEAGYRT